MSNISVLGGQGEPYRALSSDQFSKRPSGFCVQVEDIKICEGQEDEDLNVDKECVEGLKKERQTPPETQRTEASSGYTCFIYS